MLVLMLAACGLRSRPLEPPAEDAGDEALDLDAGQDAGTDAGEDAGEDAGDAHGDAGHDAGSDAGDDGGSAPPDAGIPVVPITFDWMLRGAVDEYSIASAASGSNIIWLRYVLGSTGVITTLRKSDGMLLSALPYDLAPYNVVSDGQQAAFIGRGVASVSDWRVQWMSSSGAPLTRTASMDVVVTTGGIIAGAMFTGSRGSPLVHVVGPRDSSGTHVSAYALPDGGVRRTETPCGPVSWWGGARAGNTLNRFFIGAVQANPCNFGDGRYVTPPNGQFQLVLVRYLGDEHVVGGGVPTVRTLDLASNALYGPAAIGATEDSVWIAYYSATSHLRLERYSALSVQPDAAAQAEATGSAFVTQQSALGLRVVEVLPHPARDRVYVLATVADSKATFAGEVLPTLDRQTLAVFVFDRSARLLSVRWLPSTNAPKSGSAMMLTDERLVVSGQCEATPPQGTTDPLCNPLQASTPSSFLFAMPAD